MNRAARPRTKRRLRYDPTSAYARGAETRARLIAAGLALFGSRGFVGASTRDIAAAAGLNAPSLQYYFDSKEGLYLACAREVAARIWNSVSARVVAAEHELSVDTGDDALIGAFCDIQSGLLAFLHGGDESGFLLAALAQAGLGPTAGLRLVHRGTRRISQVLSGIIGRLSGRASSDPECLIRTMGLIGQVLSFGVMQHRALRSLRSRRFEARTSATVQRVMREQCSAALRALIGPRRRRGRPRRASDSD